MKVPVWLLAIAFLIGAGFIGYAVIDGRQVDLYPPRIYPKLETRLAPSGSINFLKNFSDVLEKATYVIEKADSELWMAVDVPAYGAASVPQLYQPYEAALISAGSRRS